jgi:hypothetical protein
LLQARLDEEEGLKDLDVAETLLLQEFQRLPLVIVSSHDLFDHFQDTNTDADVVPRHRGSRVLLGNTCSERLESTDMSSQENAELRECLEEPAELMFFSIFLMGFHMMPAKN